MKTTAFLAAASVIATGVTTLLGGWDALVGILVAFLAMDYITGVVSAWMKKETSSKIGFRGLAKKLFIILILIMAVFLDRLTGNGTWMFRTLVCYFYIANEGLSILENVASIGVPIPSFIKSALKQLSDGKNPEDISLDTSGENLQDESQSNSPDDPQDESQEILLDDPKDVSQENTSGDENLNG